VAEVLRGFDVFALPSLNEGISNTILEAMATGLPVVASRVGGNPELVTDGEDGLLVPPLEPAAWAAALERVLVDPALAARLGEAARHTARERFSLDRTVSRTLQLYRSLGGDATLAPAAPQG